MSTLTFRGLDLLSAMVAPYVGLRFQITRGFLEPPDVRGTDVLIPAAEGRDPGDRMADRLSILLEGRVQAGTTTDWRTLTDELLAVLDENGQDPGDLVAADGYLGLSLTNSASIAARVKNYVPGPIRAGVKFQTWSIELESVAPYWTII